VVIPSPRRRLNDFILPRLCLLLMMCLVPSHFDVESQQWAGWGCVSVEEQRRRNDEGAV
ncbi:unnamed protein product, partial [Pleuronectes platessa]